MVLLDWNKRQLDGWTEDVYPMGDYMTRVFRPLSLSPRAMPQARDAPCPREPVVMSTPGGLFRGEELPVVKALRHGAGLCEN